MLAPPHHHPNPYECGTRREHFNHLRNTSLAMRSILTWGAPDQPTHPSNHHPHNITEIDGKHEAKEDDLISAQKKAVSFDVGKKIDK